jgi:hypothetical protein
MPGQLSNLLKNFDRAKGFFTTLMNNDYVKALVPIIGGGLTAYDLIERGNKIDHETNPKDIAADAAHMAVDILTLPLPPVVGAVAGKIADSVIDSASYLTDVYYGRKDPPPKAADIHGRNGPGNIANTVTTSKPFNNYIQNFGSNTGYGGGLF